jgi:hypothetical protein
MVKPRVQGSTVSAIGLFIDGSVRGLRLTVVASAATLVGSLMACGSGESVGPEPPSGQIGFVGGVGPGTGFVGGGGRGGYGYDGGPYSKDAGSNPHDAATAADAGSEPDEGTGPSGMQDAGGGEDASSSVGVMLNLTPGFFAWLDWTIAGPGGSYSGSLTFGAAQSIEFVVGGIAAAPGYTLTLRGTDPTGDPCIGTSEPFAVAPGATSPVGVKIVCFIGDGGAVPAMVMTGNVAVDAGVLQQ